MGLAGFNRARRRNLEGGVAVAAPVSKSTKGKYVKQSLYEKNYCPHCDKYFQNTAAYEQHMRFKHPDGNEANN